MNDKKFARKVSQLDKAERIIRAVHETSQRRNNVISVRLSDETLQCLDDLVSANIAQSRSDAASRLIMKGIKNHAAYLNRFENTLRKSKTFVNSYNNLFKIADWVTSVQLKNE